MADSFAVSLNNTFQHLNFNQSCDAAAEFTKWFYWGPRNKFFNTSRAIYQFVLSALPPSAEEPTKCEIMSWFENISQNNFTWIENHMYRAPFDACVNKTCQAITYAGNADIAGIGMLVSYCIEAVMATMYVGFRLVPMVRQHTMSPMRERDPAPRGHSLKLLGQRFVDAIDFTLDNFLETALVFCFATVAAGMVIVLSSDRPYDMLQCTLVTGFSLSIILALWGLHRESMRQERLRNYFFAVIITLAFAEAGVVVSTGYKYITRREYNCLNEVFSSFNRPILFFILVQAFTGLAALLVWLVIVFETPLIPAYLRESMLVKAAISIPWSAIACGYGFISFWLTLGILLRVRQLVDDRIGISDAEKSWGFGQVMALSTWLPTQVFFVHILFSKFEYFY